MERLYVQANAILTENVGGVRMGGVIFGGQVYDLLDESPTHYKLRLKNGECGWFLKSGFGPVFVGGV